MIRLRKRQEVADRQLHVATTTSTLSLTLYRVRRTDRSCLSVYVHGNGEYFEHKFGTYDFLLYFVRFIDAGDR